MLRIRRATLVRQKRIKQLQVPAAQEEEICLRKSYSEQ
jgi:hypothetical protein